MTDDRLTDDALAAIAALAKELEDARDAFSAACEANEDDSDIQLRQAEENALHALEKVEERFSSGAWGDISLLLAHIRAQDAENARLRMALAAGSDALATCLRIAAHHDWELIMYNSDYRGNSVAAKFEQHVGSREHVRVPFCIGATPTEALTRLAQAAHALEGGNDD